jgi:hypothetical protein
LAEEWRAADGALRLLSERRRLREARDSIARSEPRLVLSEPDRVPPPAGRLIDSAMHRAWQQLGLGETKVKVVMILELMPAAGVRDRPPAEEGRGTYLAPDSTDRTTCIAVIPLSAYWTRVVPGELRNRVPFDAFVQMFKGGLGPCAFYAAYGTPGNPVRRWLVARGWDLALTLDAGPRGRQRASLIGMADPRYPWYWDAVYSYPPGAVACIAGRAAACRGSVLAGAADDTPTPVPDIMRIDRRWWRTQRLAEAQRFLADVAHDVGRDRFLTFWTSPLPVDTALAAALKRPVGEWTADWQRDLVPSVRLGPAPRAGAVAIALTLAILALAVVTVTASRRQVR